jgi:AcrR family transcriptional regulator
VAAITDTASPGQARPRGNSRGESTRAKLVDAALQAFASHGFHGTTTRDIAAAADMSPAAVYVHYRTKEELLFELSLRGHRAAQDVVEAAAAAATSPESQLRRIARDYTAWHARYNTLARVVQYEMGALTPEHAEQIAGIRRAIEARVRAVISAGATAGMFYVPDLEIAALALLSLGIDVARWYREGRGWSADDIADQYAELALRLVGFRN